MEKESKGYEKINMNTLEEFFKNRISFYKHPSEGFISKQALNPEDYSLDFLKEKIKSVCYFLVSLSHLEYFSFEIALIDKNKYEENTMYYWLDSERIISMNIKKDDFNEIFNRSFEGEKNSLIYIKPNRPFHIIISPKGLEAINSIESIRGESEEEEEESEEEEEESEEEEEPKIINTEQVFKSDECTVCLSNISNVLFCNCGHLCICVECDKTKSLKNCPICKTESKIKRIID